MVFSLEKVFPSQLLFKWLSYGDLDCFSRREFAYTSQEIYSRYRSYNDSDVFKRDLVCIHPEKVHVGAVYNIPPKNHSQVAASQFIPVEKELFFDIDANDYDQVRFCSCKGTPAVCCICWELLKNAIKILDFSLKNDFGFEHIIWIFSGRRGVHGWVCDSLARKLGQEERSAIASYLSILFRDKNLGVIKLGKHVHPYLDRSFEHVLKPYFKSMVLNHSVLDLPYIQEQILSFISDQKIRQQLESRWKNEKDSIPSQKYEDLLSVLKQLSKFTDLERDIAFHFGFPRLDIQVSKQWNHLLKAPFTVHPNTEMICVPIINLENFDPTKVPTLTQVIEELDNNLKSNKSGNAVKDTSLAPYLEEFSRFVLKIEQERIKKDRINKNVEMQF